MESSSLSSSSALLFSNSHAHLPNPPFTTFTLPFDQKPPPKLSGLVNAAAVLLLCKDHADAARQHGGGASIRSINGIQIDGNPREKQVDPAHCCGIQEKDVQDGVLGTEVRLLLLKEELGLMGNTHVHTHTHTDWGKIFQFFKISKIVNVKKTQISWTT